MRASALTYAIGDVHGCAELLIKAFERIRTHARGADHAIVLLGDYVDRGPHSRRVVELLMRRRSDALMVCLRGNHEEMMARARDGDPTRLRRWLAAGGNATMSSYDKDETEPSRAVPQAHWLWLEARPLMLEDRHHIFVHAGIDPTRPLLAQGEADFLWSRRGFVDAEPHAFVETRHVVHGHTMRWAGKPDPAIPELLPHRTNLDTGAYATGVLSVGVFDVDRPGGPIDLLSII